LVGFLSCCQIRWGKRRESWVEAEKEEIGRDKRKKEKYFI
jgi:hypothetical protein